MGETSDFALRSAAPRRGGWEIAPLAVLLAGPTALAFFAGAYFDEPRAWAGLVAWALVTVAIVRDPRVLTRNRPALLALGGLALLSGWTLLSILWAPIRASAYHAGQIDVLYLGAIVAAVALLRGRWAIRAVEPALAAGTLIVIGYGLAGRFLPGLIHLNSSLTAEGRLDQPLSYWNAMGELAAIGLILTMRIAGDATRPRRLRVLAAAACAPLGMGLYLAFSRGALFAAVAGALVLIVLAPTRDQVRGLAVGTGAAIVAAVAAAPFKGMTSLAGPLSTRETQGAISLALLVLVMMMAGVAQARASRGEPGAIRLPRRAPLIVLGLVCAGLAIAIVVGAKETSKLPSGTSAARYTTLQSDRYQYWRVALDAFAAHPLNGVGAGGWAVWWLKDRTVPGYATDAHSLELQTLAELGIVGAAFLLTLSAGTALAARAALRRAPVLAVGPVAGLVVWLAHSPLDWDWQLPALSLLAAVLAGVVLALAGDAGSAEMRDSGLLGDPDPDLEAATRDLDPDNRLAV